MKRRITGLRRVAACRAVMLCLMLVAALSCPISAAQLSFSGATLKPIEIEGSPSTGLEYIYVLNNIEGVTASYRFNGDAPTWQQFSNLGGGYAIDLADVTVDGNVSTLNNLEGDRGYIVNDGGRQYCFWVVDYSKHEFTASSLEPADEQYCESTILEFSGNGAPINYFSIDGRSCVLSRDIVVYYSTQEFDDETADFEMKDIEKHFESVAEHITITPPAYAATTFTILGDRFLIDWEREKTAVSNTFYPNAVAVRCFAEQDGEEFDEENPVASNVISAGTNGLGGSAPAEITFTARGTEAMIHSEWQFSRSPQFEDIDNRFYDAETTYTFTEEGTTYVRFIGSNADGSCESESEVFTVNIASSELRCPNAFSPGASEGVNDEWKVSYRSLIDFECWIFDRYGNEIFHFTDPNMGWDGKRNGKLVKPGVYFYVIQATGSDGQKYKKSGDINIIRYRGSSGGNSGSDYSE